MENLEYLPSNSRASTFLPLNSYALYNYIIRSANLSIWFCFSCISHFLILFVYFYWFVDISTPRPTCQIQREREGVFLSGSIDPSRQAPPTGIGVVDRDHPAAQRHYPTTKRRRRSPLSPLALTPARCPRAAAPHHPAAKRRRRTPPPPG